MCSFDAFKTPFEMNILLSNIEPAWLHSLTNSLTFSVRRVLIVK